MNVHYEIKHDVEAEDGKRYVLVGVTVHQPSDPKTLLWGDLVINVWVPLRKGATIDQIRELALKEAQKKSGIFARLPRAKVVLGSA